MTMKEEFITAYVALYGGTKKSALKVYERADKSYISAIIYAFKRMCKNIFYED